MSKTIACDLAEFVTTCHTDVSAGYLGNADRANFALFALNVGHDRENIVSNVDMSLVDRGCPQLWTRFLPLLLE
jgi:hypothetical protein